MRHKAAIDCGSRPRVEHKRIFGVCTQAILTGSPIDSLQIRKERFMQTEEAG
jgi:hypothetical protein